MEVIKFDLNKMRNNLDGFSCYILGRSYDLEENGVSGDYKEALKYYYKGMEMGNPLCQYSIGISLVLGLGDVLKIDEKKGNSLLIDAYPKILELMDSSNISDEERVYAKFVTGAYYYFGLGNVKKDYKKAFEVISECANKGHIAAIYDLGANFYYNGVGVEKDLEKTRYYLDIAKEAGLPRAIEKYKEYGFSSKSL